MLNERQDSQHQATINASHSEVLYAFRSSLPFDCGLSSRSCLPSVGFPRGAFAFSLALHGIIMMFFLNFTGSALAIGHASGKQDPCETVPCKAHESPVKANEKPMKTRERPVKAREKPVKGRERPVKAREKPVKARERPVKAREKPVKGP